MPAKRKEKNCYMWENRTEIKRKLWNKRLFISFRNSIPYVLMDHRTVIGSICVGGVRSNLDGNI